MVQCVQAEKGREKSINKDGRYKTAVSLKEQTTSCISIVPGYRGPQ